MRLLPFLSFVLAAVQFSSAKVFSKLALTAGNIQQYAENIIIVKDDLPGLLLEIDVGDNEVLVQVDLGRCVTSYFEIGPLLTSLL